MHVLCPFTRMLVGSDAYFYMICFGGSRCEQEPDASSGEPSQQRAGPGGASQLFKSMERRGRKALRDDTMEAESSGRTTPDLLSGEPGKQTINISPSTNAGPVASCLAHVLRSDDRATVAFANSRGILKARRDCGVHDNVAWTHACSRCAPCGLSAVPRL